MKKRLWHLVVWLRRIGHCRGFGIQSPNDYWLVRYVINEHWPYYQYATTGQGDDWLTQKLGQLYFRLANWRQPSVITSSAYREYMQAGCHKAVFGDGIELVWMSLKDDCRERLEQLCDKADGQTVLVVEDIRANRGVWRQLVADGRTRVTFDLYYCGIALFDKKRTKKNYIINF